MLIGIIKNLDGSIGIVRPNQDLLESITMAEIVDKANPGGLPSMIIDDAKLPADRVFRNAWEATASTVRINRPRAEELHMRRLRFLRDIQLKYLDIELTIAQESQNTAEVSRIIELKQTLRDMPTTTDLSTLTLTQLKSFKPVYLDGDIEALQNKVPKATVE